MPVDARQRPGPRPVAVEPLTLSLRWRVGLVLTTVIILVAVLVVIAQAKPITQIIGVSVVWCRLAALDPVMFDGAVEPDDVRLVLGLPVVEGLPPLPGFFVESLVAVAWDKALDASVVASET